AGNGTSGFSGDGGPATSAELNHPRGIAVDGSGNLYVADEKNNRVRRVSAVGVISTVAGNGEEGADGDGGLAVLARLYRPKGVVVDSSGNLYVAAGVLRKVDAGGVISTVSKNVQPYPLQFPWGVAVDAAGNIYVGLSLYGDLPSANSPRVQKVSPGGSVTTVAGTGIPGFSGDGGPATSAQF